MSRQRIYPDYNAKKRAYQIRKYQRRRALGQCVRCQAPSPDKINCAACTEKRQVELPACKSGLSAVSATAAGACLYGTGLTKRPWRKRELKSLEILCGHCFEQAAADVDGYSTDDLATAELLAELVLPPERRRWRWITRSKTTGVK